MVDSTASPIGDLAVNPFYDDDDAIKEYLDTLENVISQCKHNHFGLVRTLIVRYFNYSYMHKQGDIRKPPSKTAMMFHMRKDPDVLDINRYYYLSRVINFCLTTDICSKLGLDVNDFMNMDLATFEYIKRKYDAYKPLEQEAASDILKDLDKLK